MFWRFVIKLLMVWGLSPALFADVFIKNVHLINKAGELLGPTNVHINDGIILKINKEITAQKSDQILDGTGRFLIPGLIDSHVHLNGVPGESDDIPAKIRKQAFQQIPKSYLYFGFTSVLDLVSDDYVVKKWNKQALAPHAYHCAGAPIPGGYPLAWLPKKNQLASPMAEFYIFDPRQKALMDATPNSLNHKIEPLLQRIAKSKALCIKAFYERGFGRLSQLPVPSHTMMKQLVAEAKKYNLPVFMHGNSLESHEFAVANGAKLLVHGIWHGVNQSKSLSLQGIVGKTVDNGVAVQPTMQVIYGGRELFNPQFFDDAAVKKAMPEALIGWYQSPQGQWFAKQMLNNFTKGAGDAKNENQKIAMLVDGHTQALNNVQAHTRALLAQKARLIFGSDTPSGPLYTQFPGFNGRQEMTRWVEQGVPLTQLFRALTIENAKLMKLENKIGSIEEGKQADLLLLKSNPLKTLAAYDSIEWVILKGAVIKRESLAAY